MSERSTSELRPAPQVGIKVITSTHYVAIFRFEFERYPGCEQRIRHIFING